MTDGRLEGAGLTARALTRRYGRVLALDGVDLSVPAGTVHGLIGPNGAGKTTLLSVLLGLVRPDSGEVSLDRQPLRSAARRVPGGVAGGVEEPHFYPYVSALGNLQLLARLDGPGGLAPELAISRVGLGARAHTKAGSLSMGMRQRLGIAAGLMRRPGLLVLDEPTGGLDPAGAADLLKLVADLAADGRSVLLSSHDLVVVADVCDDVTVLVQGKVVRSASVSDLVAEAPAPTYRLRTSDDSTALAVLDQDLDVVVEVEQAGSGLSVTATQSALDHAVAGLVRRGIAIRELASHRTPLRALYDALTTQRDAA